MSRRFSDVGSVSVELAILMPMLLALVVLVIAGGRIVTADLAVEHAATAAARAASLARTPAAAHSNAISAGTRALAERNLTCAGLQVTADTGGFGRPGALGIVTVTLRCSVSLADLTGIPGLPASIPLRAVFTSPVDPYRSRS
ncbi:TadE family protein [Saccharopolyspora elongata]|uniref:Pilus assembly protein n=1 Tax=Saccharopolyspora elongata TaxID=2530387 RepID=A0A4R4YAD7_9PSEU|nr:TadE family protein [Saccharopolyspora elongata]TDD41383.1 pilus assembly protein [Saccharopolyspora elongata]